MTSKLYLRALILTFLLPTNQEDGHRTDQRDISTGAISTGLVQSHEAVEVFPQSPRLIHQQHSRLQNIAAIHLPAYSFYIFFSTAIEHLRVASCLFKGETNVHSIRTLMTSDSDQFAALLPHICAEERTAAVSLAKQRVDTKGPKTTFFFLPVKLLIQSSQKPESITQVHFEATEELHVIK